MIISQHVGVLKKRGKTMLPNCTVMVTGPYPGRENYVRSQTIDSGDFDRAEDFVEATWLAVRNISTLQERDTVVFSVFLGMISHWTPPVRDFVTQPVCTYTLYNEKTYSIRAEGDLSALQDFLQEEHFIVQAIPSTAKTISFKGYSHDVPYNAERIYEAAQVSLSENKMLKAFYCAERIKELCLFTGQENRRASYAVISR